MDPLSIPSAPLEDPPPAVVDAPVLVQSATIGIEFYSTNKGGHRAKLGPVEMVPGEGDKPVPKVVTSVLVSDTHEAEEQLTAELDVVLGAVAAGELLVIGSDYVAPAFVPVGDLTPLPAGAVVDQRYLPDLVLKESAAVPAPEHLTEPDGTMIDRRKLGIIAALDRKFDHKIGTQKDGTIDPRPRRVMLQLIDGKTLPEAVAHANNLSGGGKWAPLTDREAHDMLVEEIYRLALYIVLVQNRDIGPPSSRLG